jgi:anti-sigma regulatory factor (Ser/Thr protein kinase)
MHLNSLTVTARLDSLCEVAAFVQSEAEAAGLSAQARYSLRLAVDEIVTNIIMHGYAGVPGDERALPLIELRSEREEGVLRLIVEDTGMPFDPRHAPAPPDLELPAEERRIGGLGIYLALRAVDGFSYERVGDRNRNIFEMKRLQGSG